ncbi:MAG TPA: hypothetical protein VIG97_03960 [Luteimonas sp.]
MTVVCYKNVKRPIIPPGDMPMLALFARGEQGAWYDPSDLYSYGALGDELVPDPHFASPGAWELDEETSIEDGVLLYSGTTGRTARVGGGIRTVAGMTYEVTVDFKSRASGSFYVLGFPILYIQGGNEQRIVRTLVGNGAVLGIRTYSGGIAEIRELSVRAIPRIEQATMFQDAAGTIPVTGVEQPVGLILDKSGNGNNALQVTAPARPTLSARVNNLTDSERFEAWATAGAVAMRDPETIAPDGLSVASKLQAIPGDGGHYIRRGNVGAGVGAPTCRSLYVKRGTARHVWISVYTNTTPTNPLTARIDFDTGSVNDDPASGQRMIEMLDDGWYRIIFRRGAEASVYNQFGIGFSDPANPTNNSYAADGEQTVYIWGAQHELGTKATKYQRVNTASDYNWKGWPLYLQRDGVDDFMRSVIPAPVMPGMFLADAYDRQNVASSHASLAASSDQNGNDYLHFFIQTSERVQSRTRGLSLGLGVASTLSAPGSVPLGRACVMEAVLDSDSLLLAVDGAHWQAESNWPSGASFGTATNLTSNSSSNLGRTYGYIALWRAPNEKERAAVRKFLTDKTKVPE